MSCENDGCKGMISASLPHGMYKIEGDMSYKKIILSAKSPSCEHELVAHVHKFMCTPEKKLLNAELVAKSSYLPYDIKYNVDANIEPENKIFHHSLVIGNTVHSLKAEYTYSLRNINILLDIETTLFDINKFTINSIISTGRVIKAKTTLAVGDETHAFDLRLNPSEQKITCVIKSPSIQGEVMKIEASIDGSSQKFDLNALIRFDGKTYAAKFNFRNTDKLYGSLEVKTPYRGYRKMNFIASYEAKDKIVVVFNANNPLKLKLELVLGKDTEGYKTTINIVTPIKDYENVSVNIVVPVHKIAPKLQVKVLDVEYKLEFEFVEEKYSKKCEMGVNLGGQEYSAGGEIRYKAPYELSYFYQIASYREIFHIMTDSSMLKALLLPATWLF